ncbi:MAG: AAA family ATPase [Planctomycetes bacterium]|nr:AAA family ATPase [Planctomycetota bacterium]
MNVREGEVIGGFGWQGQGKTTGAIVLAEEINRQAVEIWGEPLNGPISNIELKGFPGSVWLDNAGLRDWIGRMVSEEYRGYIILIDEIDGVWPHRFWNDRKQGEQTVLFWQNRKLGNYIIYTSHMLGTDKTIREATNYMYIPEYKRIRDELEFHVTALSKGWENEYVVCDVSDYFEKFNSWGIVN